MFSKSNIKLHRIDLFPTIILQLMHIWIHLISDFLSAQLSQFQENFIEKKKRNSVWETTLVGNKTKKEKKSFEGKTLSTVFVIFVRSARLFVVIAAGQIRHRSSLFYIIKFCSMIMVHINACRSQTHLFFYIHIFVGTHPHIYCLLPFHASCIFEDWACCVLYCMFGLA